MKQQKNDILILGMGSEILKDDGLPLRVLKDLEEEFGPAGISYRSANTGGLDMLDHICGFDSVFIIDTIETPQGNPGDVHLFTPHDHYMESFHLSSYHDATFPVTLALGEKLGLHVPEEIRIIAVEIIEGLELSITHSDRIEEMYQDILKNIKKIIRQTILDGNLQLINTNNKAVENEPI